MAVINPAAFMTTVTQTFLYVPLPGATLLNAPNAVETISVSPVAPKKLRLADWRDGRDIILSQLKAALPPGTDVEAVFKKYIKQFASHRALHGAFEQGHLPQQSEDAIKATLAAGVEDLELDVVFFKDDKKPSAIHDDNADIQIPTVTGPYSSIAASNAADLKIAVRHPDAKGNWGVHYETSATAADIWKILEYIVAFHPNVRVTFDLRDFGPAIFAAQVDDFLQRKSPAFADTLFKVMNIHIYPHRIQSGAHYVEEALARGASERTIRQMKITLCMPPDGTEIMLKNRYRNEQSPADWNTPRFRQHEREAWLQSHVDHPWLNVDRFHVSFQGPRGLVLEDGETVDESAFLRIVGRPFKQEDLNAVLENDGIHRALDFVEDRYPDKVNCVTSKSITYVDDDGNLWRDRFKRTKLEKLKPDTNIAHWFYRFAAGVGNLKGVRRVDKLLSDRIPEEIAACWYNDQGMSRSEPFSLKYSPYSAEAISKLVEHA